MSHKRVPRDDSDSESDVGDASYIPDADIAASQPCPKRGKQPASTSNVQPPSAAGPSRSMRKVGASRNTAPISRSAFDLDLPNEGFALELVHEPLVLRKGKINPNPIRLPPRSKDYTRHQARVFDRRIYDPADDATAEFIDDDRFQSLFQLDYYNSAIFCKKHPVVPQKWIDWQHCVKVGDPDMDKALATMERCGFKDLLTMHYPWNTEVIAQFYATVWFEAPSEEQHEMVHFRIQGRNYSVSYGRFAAILGFGPEDLAKPLLRASIDDVDLSHCYYDHASESDIFSTKNMKKYYRYINLLVRQGICPKIGSATEVLSYVKTLFVALKEEDEQSFSAFDFIYRQIKATSFEPMKSCTHAPFVMKMIEIVTKKEFSNKVRHEYYRPVKIDETAKKKRGRKPSKPQQQSPPQPQSSGSPVLSPPQGYETTSRAAAAASPRTHPRPSRGRGKDLLLRTVRSVFGMCMANNEAIRRHQQFVQEQFHRAEVQRKSIAEQAGIHLSPVRRPPPPPQQPEWFHPQYQGAYQQQQQPPQDTQDPQQSVPQELSFEQPEQHQSFSQQPQYDPHKQPQSSSHAEQGVGVITSSTGWAQDTYALAGYLFDPSFDAHYPACYSSTSGCQQHGNIQESDNTDFDV